MHMLLLVLGAWVPGLQGIGCVAATKLKWPIGLSSHCIALLRFVAEL